MLAVENDLSGNSQHQASIFRTSLLTGMPNPRTKTSRIWRRSRKPVSRAMTSKGLLSTLCVIVKQRLLLKSS